MSGSLEYQAGSALVEGGISFKVGRRKFTIEPLRPGTIIRISKLVTKLKSMTSDLTVTQVLEVGDNLKIIAEIIATAIINRKVFSRWRFFWYRWLLLNRVESLEFLHSYLLIVYRQLGAEHFFFIMASTPAMNFLKKIEEKQEEEKQSSEP